mmetsp:Transcript_59956/g.175927  ORF Transcript_59956/g.175927 Transcript_59956/m.175927 type:complete len:234 (-) Transcript_59956:449-1150(-)
MAKASDGADTRFCPLRLWPELASRAVVPIGVIGRLADASEAPQDSATSSMLRTMGAALLHPATSSSMATAGAGSSRSPRSIAGSSWNWRSPGRSTSMASGKGLGMGGRGHPGGVSIAAKSSGLTASAAQSSLTLRRSGSCSCFAGAGALTGSGLSAQEATRPRCRGGFQPFGFIIRMKSPKFMESLPHASKIIWAQSSTGLSGKSRCTWLATMWSSPSASKKRKAARSMEPRQ